ncbi:MAG: hypothetical protein HDR28_10935 [Lachnospiraceae bacterium]|nr:hypothetical protein [Lachnospiraceae bacterium]
MSENEKLDLILSEMQGMKSDVRELKDEMQGIKGDVQGMKDEMQSIKDDMQGMKNEIQGMKNEMQDMKDRTQVIEQKVTGVHLILENEIRVNIQRVAEGHLDLSRNLHDAMRPSNEVEMLAIKVRMLESDMREVKAKIG